MANVVRQGRFRCAHQPCPPKSITPFGVLLPCFHGRIPPSSALYVSFLSKQCFYYAVLFLLKKKKHAHHQAVMIFIFRPFLKINRLLPAFEIKRKDRV